jgi:hypothetical protein
LELLTAALLPLNAISSAELAMSADVLKLAPRFPAEDSSP